MSASRGSAGARAAAAFAAVGSAALVPLVLLLAASGTVAQTGRDRVGAPIPLRPSPTEPPSVLSPK